MRFLKVLKAVFVSPFVRLAKKVANFFKAIWLFFKALFSLSSVLSNVEVFQKKLEKVEDVINQHVRWLTKIESKVDKMEEELKAGDVPKDDGAKKLEIQSLDFVEAMSREDVDAFLSKIHWQVILDAIEISKYDGSSKALCAGIVRKEDVPIEELAKLYNRSCFRKEIKGHLSKRFADEGVDGLPEKLGLPTIEASETGDGDEAKN